MKWAVRKTDPSAELSYKVGLGCVNPRPVAKGSQEVGFTQPRAHLIAQFSRPHRSVIRMRGERVRAKDRRPIAEIRINPSLNEMNERREPEMATC